jgi:hypothetical protein
VALTTYIILSRVNAVDAERNGIEAPADGSEVELPAEESFEAFRKIDAVNAHSTDQALRKAAEKYGDGYFVAVAQRAWKGEEFETETVTRVKAKSA